MANFITTFSKLTGPTDYPFWEIYIKSTLAFIIYPGAVFTADNMLNALALSQTTNMNEIAKRNFLSSQVLAVLNFILPDNLLMHI